MSVVQDIILQAKLSLADEKDKDAATSLVLYFIYGVHKLQANTEVYQAVATSIFNHKDGLRKVANLDIVQGRINSFESL